MTLREWMVVNKKSRDDVAAVLDVSVVSVGRYLTGERVPKAAIIRKIKAMTQEQVTADDFLDSAKNMAA